MVDLQMNSSQIACRIFRFDPSSAEEPTYEEYLVPRTPNMRVLDVLNWIYERKSSFGYRWYCGTKKCGECAIMVNGIPILGCWEPAPDGMICEPLSNFPIIRDLVVDTAPYEATIMKLQPLLRRSARPRFPEKLSHATMVRAHRLSKCIECNVCTAAVPANDIDSEGIQWEGYSGPAALVRFARFVLDPRDEMDRSHLGASAGLKDFPLFSGLGTICPQGIDIINDALIPAYIQLFGAETRTTTELHSTTPFIMAQKWNAFVRLTDHQKTILLQNRKIEAVNVPGVKEAYKFVESLGKGP